MVGKRFNQRQILDLLNANSKSTDAFYFIGEHLGEQSLFQQRKVSNILC